MNNCLNCAFLVDYSGTQFASIFKDGVKKRCLKESRWQNGWPQPVRKPSDESCEFFLKADPLRSRWEWNENKNQQTIGDRGVSFQDAIRALESDPFHLRCPVGDTEKWEKLDDLDFEAQGIPRTSASCDRVRDKHLFMMGGNLYLMISTLRGELGALRQRVISVRRTRDKDDLKAYESAKAQVRKGHKLT